MNGASLPNFGLHRGVALLTGIVAGVLSLIGLLINRQQFFHSYLFAWLFWSGLSFGALVVLMMQVLTGGLWGLAVSRLAGAALALLPWMALLFIPILARLGDVYKWTHGQLGESGGYNHKKVWLNEPSFLARSIIYFLLLAGVALLLKRWAPGEENLPEPRPRTRALSSIGLIVYVLCMNFASTDWVMSVTPEWYSTIFVIVFMAGHFLSALALVTGLLTWMAKDRFPRSSGGTPPVEAAGIVQLPSKVFSDLGNMLLAFVIFWTYVTFAQLLIIWSGNLPKEISWYLPRSGGGWQWVAVALAIFEFALPFVLLLSREVKKTPHRLGAICGCILLGSVLNNFWQVAPSFHPEGFYLHWLDVTLFIAFGGIWFGLFFGLLNQQPILPQRLEVASHG